MATSIVAPEGATPNCNERVIVETLAQLISAAMSLNGDDIHIDTAGLLHASRDWLEDEHWENGDNSFSRAASSLQGALALDERHHPQHTDRHSLIQHAAELADTTASTYTSTMAGGYVSAVCIRAALTLSRFRASTGQEVAHG